jgi:single-stranded DNA-binding protein
MKNTEITMHKNVNKWIGEGQIKGDLLLRKTQNNYNVANFVLKIDTSYKVSTLGNNTSKHKDETIYVPVVAWDELAENLTAKYTQNDIVRVIGRLSNNTKATSKSNWEVVLEDISLIKSIN